MIRKDNIVSIVRKVCWLVVLVTAGTLCFMSVHEWGHEAVNYLLSGGSYKGFVIYPALNPFDVGGYAPYDVVGWDTYPTLFYLSAAGLVANALVVLFCYAAGSYEATLWACVLSARELLFPFSATISDVARVTAYPDGGALVVAVFIAFTAAMVGVTVGKIIGPVVVKKPVRTEAV